MKDWRKLTLDTYNASAKELAAYFEGIGSRTEDIEIALGLCPNPKRPKIIEIGCGDGRDAKEIVKHTSDYIGFDISKELIKLAQEKVPGAKFEVNDALTFNYPASTDIVFAFASLLHLNIQEIKHVMVQVEKSLKPGGIFYISLKLAPAYKQQVKEDKFGSRLFYFYNPAIITKLAGRGFEVVQTANSFTTVGNTRWFEIALRKIANEDV